MKRIDERPSYILTASLSEMIVSVETPFPATVRVKVPAISAMAGARIYPETVRSLIQIAETEGKKSDDL